MSFDSIVGQGRVVEYLRKALRSGRVGHAYLFHGPAGVGKFAAAREFAKVLLCPNAPQGTDSACEACPSCRQVDQLAHPNLRVVLPGPKEIQPATERETLDQLAAEPYRVEQLLSHPNISIERIRELKQFVAYAPSPGQRRVALVPAADRMTAEAANSFLKLLEEPPEELVIVLTATDPGALFQTIVSRCQTIRFPAIPVEELAQALKREQALDDGQALLIATLAAGSYGQALEWLAEDMKTLRAQAVELLRRGLQGLSNQVKYARELAPRAERQTRQRMLNLLDVLQVWLRDALLVKELGDEARQFIVNRDDQEVLLRFNHGLSEIHYDSLFEAVDEAAFQLRRNVSILLALAGLMGRFNRSLRR